MRRLKLIWPCLERLHDDPIANNQLENGGEVDWPVLPGLGGAAFASALSQAGVNKLFSCFTFQNHLRWRNGTHLSVGSPIYIWLEKAKHAFARAGV